MKSLFIVPSGVELPPMKDEVGPQLHYVDADGNLAGGYSLVGLALEGGIYEVDASSEVIALLKSSLKEVRNLTNKENSL